MLKFLKNGSQIAALALLSFQSSFAISIFSDGFESDAIGLNATPSKWGLTRQSVDVVDTTWILGCYSGSNCLDLDGTTRLGGRIQSQNFNFAAGITYTLTFYLSENQRGFDIASDFDEVTVSLGSLGTQTIVLANTAAYTWKAYTIQVTGDGSSGAIVFDHAGGDNVGILLDDVNLDASALAADVDTPEPASIGLLLSGLALVAMRRRS